MCVGIDVVYMVCVSVAMTVGIRSSQIPDIAGSLQVERKYMDFVLMQVSPWYLMYSLSACPFKLQLERSGKRGFGCKGIGNEVV